MTAAGLLDRLHVRAVPIGGCIPGRAHVNRTLTRRKLIALAAAAPLGESTLARTRGTDENGFVRIDPQTRILLTRLAPTALTVYIADGRAIWWPR